MLSAKDKVNYELDQQSASIATRTPLSIRWHITNSPDCECHSLRLFTENQSVFLVSWLIFFFFFFVTEQCGVDHAVFVLVVLQHVLLCY